MVTEIINEGLRYVTLASHILVIVFIGLFLTNRDFLRTKPSRYFVFAFVVSVVATLGSLFYSQVMGFDPCKLCWFQRIFMYPQVFLLGVALFMKESKAAIYGIVLSGIGLLIAVYHYILQRGLFSGSVTCSVVGYSASCSENFFTFMGYITIPFMSVTAFALIILSLVMFLTENKFQSNLRKELRA